MLSKNLSLGRLCWIIPQRLVLDGIAALQSVVENKSFVDLWAILKAHFAFYASIFSIIKKRQSLHLPYDLPVTMYKRSVLWKYFLERKKTVRQLFKF